MVYTKCTNLDSNGQSTVWEIVNLAENKRCLPHHQKETINKKGIVSCPSNTIYCVVRPVRSPLLTPPAQRINEALVGYSVINNFRTFKQCVHIVSIN